MTILTGIRVATLPTLVTGLQGRLGVGNERDGSTVPLRPIHHLSIV